MDILEKLDGYLNEGRKLNDLLNDLEWLMSSSGMNYNEVQSFINMMWKKYKNKPREVELELRNWKGMAPLNRRQAEELAANFDIYLGDL